jgi:hypothetical protein
MTEYEHTGADLFWQKWSKDGKQLTTTMILQALKEERGKVNKNLAAEAKAKYGDVEFDQVFGYRKGGKSGVCQTEGAIASRYQRMKEIGGK